MKPDILTKLPPHSIATPSPFQLFYYNVELESFLHSTRYCPSKKCQLKRFWSSWDISQLGRKYKPYLLAYPLPLTCFATFIFSLSWSLLVDQIRRIFCPIRLMPFSTAVRCNEIVKNVNNLKQLHLPMTLVSQDCNKISKTLWSWQLGLWLKQWHT